jgi:ATP-dependent exoDNAse (exonuclease V) beta subunit
MGAPPVIPDLAERTRALDPSRSFIVQAPAGSGKTELLIQRYLALLATVTAPEEIVAITFTRKAAGEMRQRVLAALADALRPERPPGGAHEARTLELARTALAQDAERRWQLAANPNRLRIQTIDALCASLTRQMPLLSRFGAAPEIVERAEHLYREAARGVIARVESRQDVAASVERLLVHLDNDAARLEELLAEMLARRDHWTRHGHKLDRGSLEAALANVRAEALQRARGLLTDTQRAELAAFGGYAFANLERAPFADDVEAWAALADLLLVQKGTWRVRLGPKEGVPPGKTGAAWKARTAALALGDEFREALAELRRLPPPRYSDAQWDTLAAIATLLKHALAELRVVFGLRNEVDFAALGEGAVQALGEDDAPTDLALALDYRIRHLLVDEFQDTSISQYELIAKLTAGWEPGDGRTLFAVGDPMQSIYRFREAEVGEFLRTWDTRRLGGVALERVGLSANFRSQAGIVAWVNAAFARVMPAHEDIAVGAVPYAATVPVREALAETAVAVHPFFDRDAEGEAARVVDLVARVRADAPGATIAVLVRNRGSLSAIVPRLRARGLRFRAIEIEALGDRPVVQDLLALTRALAHPADRVAWLAVLRAPWCGATLADLAALAEGRAETVWELMTADEGLARLTPDGAGRIARVRDVLATSLAGRFRGSLRDRVEATWLMLGGPACVPDATDLEDADVYLDALAAAEEAGALPDLAAFERQLAELWALPDARADDRDVQIMTIHKAKGLQFDHVIVPGLGGRAREEPKRLFLWTERPSGVRGGDPELLVAPIEETGAETDATYAWLRRLDADRGRHEAARLLYVAATRARERVHLLGDVLRDDRTGAPKPPPAGTLLATLWPIVGEHYREAAAAPATPAGAAAAGARVRLAGDLVRLASDWRLAEPPPAARWRPPADEARAHDDIEFSWVGETARHAGSVAHRWLQRIAEDRLAGWDAGRIDRLRGAVRNELSARGVRDADLDDAGERVLAALRNAIEDERGRWLLGPHPYAVSELRLTAVIDGAIRRLVVDRVFQDASGERWIVDYKTSSHEGADPEAFLDRERERYAAQLARYSRAAGGGHRLGLYFPLLQGWRDAGAP